MQPSTFTIRVPLPDRGQVFLMNTLTEAQALVSADVGGLLDRLDGSATADDLLASLDATGRETLATLVDQGFVVSSRRADGAALDEFFEHVRHDRSQLHVTVLTTLQCNFSCDYCYQGDHDDSSSAQRMTNETSARVVEWVDERMELLAPRSLMVTFFGGEPLLNKPVLYALAEALWQRAAARGIDMRTSVITNGLLLTPEVVDRLLPFGLAGIKVTLDGDRTTHDRMRPLRGGQPSFDRIIENVRRVAHRTAITIGGNFDVDSAESFPALLDFLREQEFAPQLRRVAFKPVIRPEARAKPSLSKGITLAQVDAGAATGRTCASITGASGTASRSTPCDSCGVATDQLTWLREETVKRGLPAPDGLHMGPCNVHRKHAYTIGPDGAIYACPGFTNDVTHAVGHISRPPTTTQERRAEDFGRLAPWRACGDCAFIPVCAGGCSVASHTELGDMHAPTCHKASFESAVRALAVSAASGAH